ncbi:MAG: hypothetical protein IKR92_04240 [Alphaproteobacteria bacterium]|nr:hypothetical protein [Alphaproteobacteria bacterium]
MNDEFNFAEVTTIADDFAARKEQYDALMEDAVKDLTNAIKNVKSGRDASALSDDIAGLMEEHGEKFGKALGSANKAEREKWAPELAGILTKAIDMEPENIESIVRGAYQIEKAYEGADSGVFASVVDKAMFRHRSYAGKIMAVVDESFQDYEAQPRQDAATYRTFGKIYGSAFGKTGNKAYADKANDILEKTELVKGNITVEKLLKQLQENPGDETAQDAFEKKLGMVMAANPTAATEDILENLRDMTKIENNEDREFVYTAVIGVLSGKLKADSLEEKEKKSSVLFSAFDMFLKKEKNPEIRKSTTVSAMAAIQRDLVDDKGGLIIDDISEIETFRSLKKMADCYGDYDGFKDMIVNTAAKYRKSKEKTKDLRECMMKIFDYVLKPLEKAEGKPYVLDSRECSDFENSVFKERRERNLDAQIYTILNIPSKELGVERDPNKTFYPSKEEMQKVVNLLSQHSSIKYNVALAIAGKIDKEKFTNIDDAILKKLSDRAQERMESGDFKMFEDEHLTPIRTAFHKHGIQQKKQQDGNAPKQWHEKTAKKEPEPKKTISFSVKDLPNSIEK